MFAIGHPKYFMVPWPNPYASVRVFCFPYAGGSAAVFRDWPELMPSSIELVSVQLPGRANRISEKLLTSVEEIASELVSEIPPLLDLPYLFYGHSYGACVAFESLHKISSLGLPQPQGFIAGARNPPHLVLRREPIHHLSDADMLSELKKLGGIQDEVFSEASLREILCPIIRADLTSAYEYQRSPKKPLSARGFAFGGRKDLRVGEANLARWSEHFESEVEVRMFDGGHFFMTENKHEVIKSLVSLV